jgi:hypothetical protein
MFASTRVLFENIVDYAGTFPPAGLCLTDTLHNYARARNRSEKWLVGRLVLPESSLGEFEMLRPGLIDGGGDPAAWRPSIVLAGDGAKSLDRVQALGIAAIEFPPVDSRQICDLASRVPHGIEAFFETPIDADLETRLDAISGARASAKVRTGGVTPGAFPTPAALARFLVSSAKAGVAFKATAGLHHAIRSCYPLTYEPNSPTEHMHGFLNLSVAAALVKSEVDEATVADALADSSSAAFEFEPDGVLWRGFAIGLETLTQTRRFFRSFGSCSLREPAEELARMSLL